MDRKHLDALEDILHHKSVSIVVARDVLGNMRQMLAPSKADVEAVMAAYARGLRHKDAEVQNLTRTELESLRNHSEPVIRTLADETLRFHEKNEALRRPKK